VIMPDNYTAKSGKIYKSDGTIINIADIIDEVVQNGQVRVDAVINVDISDVATETKQDDIIDALSDLETAVNDVEDSVDVVALAVNDVEDAVDVVALAVNDVEDAVDAVEIAVNAVEVAVDAVETALNDVSTESKQDDIIAALNNVYAELNIVVKASFSGDANLTYNSAVGNLKEIAIYNSSDTDDLTFTIGGITVPVAAGTGFSGKFATFTQVSVVATDDFYAVVKG